MSFLTSWRLIFACQAPRGSLGGLQEVNARHAARVIGLDAGPNTFFYVLGSPLKFTDPLGLKGCGSGFWEFAVPNNPPDYNLGRDLPFEKCCDMHDACYEDCGRTPTKFNCDFRFWSRMIAKCSRYRGDVRFRCDDLAYKCAGATANMKRAQTSF